MKSKTTGTRVIVISITTVIALVTLPLIVQFFVNIGAWTRPTFFNYASNLIALPRGWKVESQSSDSMVFYKNNINPLHHITSSLTLAKVPHDADAKILWGKSHGFDSTIVTYINNTVGWECRDIDQPVRDRIYRTCFSYIAGSTTDFSGREADLAGAVTIMEATIAKSKRQ